MIWEADQKADEILYPCDVANERSQDNKEETPFQTQRGKALGLEEGVWWGAAQFGEA